MPDLKLHDPLQLSALLSEVANKYPRAATIHVGYHGEGDSFSDFLDVVFYDKNSRAVKYKANEFISDHEDLLWLAIGHSNASFNNEGSHGTVIFDLTRLDMSVENYYYDGYGTEYVEEEDENGNMIEKEIQVDQTSTPGGGFDSLSDIIERHQR